MRTTWQIKRKTVTNPATGSVSLMPTVATLPIGQYVASQLPAKTNVMESRGVPIVAIDAWIPDFPASVDIQEGDIAVDLERNVPWEVEQVYHYPTRTVVGLKTVKSKSTK